MNNKTETDSNTENKLLVVSRKASGGMGETGKGIRKHKLPVIK